MTTKRYAVLILAAGYSSRMGAFKPLLPVRGQTLADRVISIFQGNGVEVILVTGWRRDELVKGIKTQGITLVDNPDYDRGMFTSVQAGIRRLQPDHQAFFVMPVDIPLVRQDTIARLMAEGDQHPGKIIYPVFKGKRGHPPLLPVCLADTIINQQEDSSLDTVLKLRQDIAREVSVPDSYILFNLNTPEDYKTILEQSQRDNLPAEKERASPTSTCHASVDVQIKNLDSGI